MNSKATTSLITIQHYSILRQKELDERKYFYNLSQEEKVKHICFQIELVLEYEDILDQYTNEETDALSAKIASGTTTTNDYTEDELEMMDMFYSYHEHGINDANVEVQYIFDKCLYTWFNKEE